MAQEKPLSEGLQSQLISGNLRCRMRLQSFTCLLVNTLREVIGRDTGRHVSRKHLTVVYQAVLDFNRTLIRAGERNGFQRLSCGKTGLICPIFLDHTWITASQILRWLGTGREETVSVVVCQMVQNTA